MPQIAQAAPLAGVSGGAGGILGVAGAAPTTDIFTLLLNQGNTLPAQENFSTTGQNVPQTPQLDAEKLKTVDNSIDVLQSVLTNLIVQQSIPQQQQQQLVDSVAGAEGSDVLLGGLQSQTIGNISAEGADNLVQQVQNNISSEPVINKVQQGKTLDAYRQAANLVLPEVGSTLDASDSNAITAALSLPETDATKVTSKQDAIVSLLESKDQSPETLANSISRLKNLSAITPLPVAKETAQVAGAVESNKPLEQIASLQKALAGVKTETIADKPAVKADAQTANNAAINNTFTPQAVAQTSQQNLSQQFGQKKQSTENIESLKAGGEKIDVSDLLAQQSSAPKLDGAKLPTHEFAQHLNKAAIGSPSEQIAMQIAKLPSGKQNITVQLDPADLGKVDIKLEISNDGRTQISIAAERKETLDMLKNDMGSLQRSLADSGIKADAGTMQFNLKNQEGFASQLNQGDGQKNNNNQSSQQLADIELKQTIESASLAARYINLNNLLDLKV